MSARSQKALIWWSLALMTAYGSCMRFLLPLLPPPTATWTAADIARYYVDHGSEVRIGAAIAGCVAGFLIPLTVVVAAQMSRHETGRPVWSMAAFAGGILTTVSLALAPICFGAAAFTPTRAPEITALMHEFGLLTMVTTEQWYIFMWVAVTVICLAPNSVVNSPFPRWFGYFTAWSALLIELGAIAFLTRTGPFAWNGLLSYWAPLVAFGAWITVMAVLLFKAINQQDAAKEQTPITGTPVAA